MRCCKSFWCAFSAVSCCQVMLLFLAGVVRAHYTPQWAVHITGGQRVADKVASEHGFINLGQIMEDYYHFQGRGVARRSAEPHDGHQAKLEADDRVHWAKQQRVRSRKKRDLLMLNTPTKIPTSPLQAQPQPLARVASLSSISSPGVLLSDIMAQGSIVRGKPVNDVNAIPLNDQRWPQMWYLNRGAGLDMNVLPAWKEGVTGKGVVVTILDDGLEKDHPDLIRNYDPLASYDVNNHDEDPMPRYDMIDSNRHGTRCAGEVAATANNSICAVGVAFGASVGGVRMLDGDVTDAVEARSLSLNPQHIDIYSASWGPDDDGKTVDGPGELATRAFIEGVTKGRGGKGSIFVWASGNGGRDHDNCNCDGYTNSIWTLSISSATQSGHVPWYSEACSSTLATTYSSGSLGENQVITTDLHHSCTSSHTGTSASAPLAAGICALALEANPNLTWRDMQHIVVRTARPANLYTNDWLMNGVGRNVSHSFGYGLMDATAMVRLARSWKTVPEQYKCEISAQITDPTIPAKSRKKFSLIVQDCPGVSYLEHVQAKISLSTMRRGDLEINLTSPAGTRSTLLAHRSHDFSKQGFVSWPFMSVHTWGEQPFGEWKLEIHNEGRTLINGALTEWKLVLYGTTTLPGANNKPNIEDVEFPSPEHPASVVNNIDTNPDLNQNSINSPSDEWIEEPQIQNELIHVDVQRTTTDDMANSACSKSNGQFCLECMLGTYLLNGKCVPSCPTQFYSSTNNISDSQHNITITVQRICEPCHYTCLLCSGPNDYQCTQCYGDGVLTNTSSIEFYCYPSSLLPNINSTKWFYRTYILLLIVIFILITAIFIFLIKWICSRVTNSDSTTNLKKMYSRINITDLEGSKDLAKQFKDVIDIESDSE